MNILALTRARDWWEYKIPPILAIGYMVIYHSGSNSIDLFIVLIMLVLSLINGAAYVSMLNDATDVADDAVAGKRNRMAGFGNIKKAGLVAMPLLTGFCFALYFSSDRLSMWLYISCYLCFTLYSLPPFRLKKRGISGVVADAAGSQLFPTLYVATFLFFKTMHPVSYYQLACIGAWSCCLGIRGILWHQYHDMKNDLISGTNTIVSRLGKRMINITGSLLMFVELAAFAILMLGFHLIFPAFVLFLYFLYLFALHARWKVDIIMFRPATKRYRIFMNEYYHALLPLSILMSAGCVQPSAFVLAVLHFLVFPSNTIRIVKEAGLLITNKKIVRQRFDSPSVPVK